jgi:hypothetical protein
MNPIEHRYDAFISYNHAADGELAPAIERGLQRLAKPWYKLRALSIFRDVSDTGLNPGLWETVQRQLEGSSWLIVLACPESAASQWVRREVNHWCDTRGVEQLLIVLTGGELVWDAATATFSAESTALAPDVAARYRSEPLWLDLRWAKALPDVPSLRHASFASDMARLASPIRGLPPDELESEDLRLHRTARRLARGAIAALVTLAIIASLAAVIAVRNANRAERRAQEALARQLGLEALDMPPSDLDAALLVSAAAGRLDPSGDPARYRASRTLLGRHARLVSFERAPEELGRTSLRGLTIAPDGSSIAATAWPEGGEPVVVTWASDGSSTVERLDDPLVPAIHIRADGSVLTGVTPGAPGLVAIDGDGRRAIAMSGLGAQLIDPATGEMIAQWADAPSLAAIVDDRFAAISDDRLVLGDADDGTELASAPLASPLSAIGVRNDTVVTADADGVSWWMRDGRVLRPIDEPRPATEIGSPIAIIVGPTGERALVVGDGGTLLVDREHAATSAADAVTGGLAVDPTGRYVAVGGTRLTIWDLQRGQRVLASDDDVTAMSWSRCDDGGPCRLVTTGEAIDVWEPAIGRRVRLADQTNAQAVDITADGDTVVTAGWGSTVARWTLTVAVDDAGREMVTAGGSAASHDEATATTATARDGGIDVVGRDRAIRIDSGPVDTIRLLAGASRLLVEHEGTRTLFDVATREPVDLAPGCVGERWAVSPGGQRVVAYRASDGRTVVCSTIDGSVVALAAVGAPITQVTAVAVDDDGSVALAGNGLVELLTVADGGFTPSATAIDARFSGERVVLGPLALSRGRVAAGVRPVSSAGAFARVLVWDAVGGGTPVQFETDHRELAAIALLGDDADLVAAAGRSEPDGPAVVQVWESDSRRRLGRGLDGLSGDVVVLAGDAEVVVATDLDGRTFRWRLDQDPRREICEIVGRPLTQEEWDTMAGGAVSRYPLDPVCG